MVFGVAWDDVFALDLYIIFLPDADHLPRISLMKIMPGIKSRHSGKPGYQKRQWSGWEWMDLADHNRLFEIKMCR